MVAAIEPSLRLAVQCGDLENAPAKEHHKHATSPLAKHKETPRTRELPMKGVCDSNVDEIARL